MNKEHLFPRWLVERCDAASTRIPWTSDRRVFAGAATLPLCVECNADFGRELEGPVQLIFTALESGEEISDEQAELLIRWMWKIKGLAWIAGHPQGDCTNRYSLRERVLTPIDEVRGSLVLGLARFAELDAESSDYPMGLNTYTEVDAIFAAGVLSGLAVVVTVVPFVEFLPDQYQRLQLVSTRADGAGRTVLAPITFSHDVEAVGVSASLGRALSRLHDEVALLAQMSDAV
jgi:hypothetical protein